MAINTADMPLPLAVARAMAAQTECLVVAVDFVNTSGRLGNHPFPAALNQCAAVVEWLASPEEKQRRAIGNIVVTGQSGGAWEGVG